MRDMSSPGSISGSMLPMQHLARNVLLPSNPARCVRMAPRAAAAALLRRCSASPPPPPTATQLVPTGAAHLVRVLTGSHPFCRTDWGAALGNAENAKLAVGALRDALADAVYLDEEAFAAASSAQLYAQRLTVSTQGACRVCGGAACQASPATLGSPACPGNHTPGLRVPAGIGGTAARARARGNCRSPSC